MVQRCERVELLVRRWLVASMSVALPARAAELRFDPPADCSVTRDSIEAQVERLIGRPLSGVDAIDFELRVRRAGDRWRLTLRTKRAQASDAQASDAQGNDAQGNDAQGSAAGAVHARQISGASCAEVTDAAAVAIALTIEGREPPADEAEPWDEVPEDALDAEPPVVPKQVTVGAWPTRYACTTGLGWSEPVGNEPRVCTACNGRDPSNPDNAEVVDCGVGGTCIAYCECTESSCGVTLTEDTQNDASREDEGETLEGTLVVGTLRVVVRMTRM